MKQIQREAGQLFQVEDDTSKGSLKSVHHEHIIGMHSLYFTGYLFWLSLSLFQYFFTIMSIFKLILLATSFVMQFWNG